MASSHAWHSRTDRINGHWPVPVPLMPNELFSTWLVRAALAQGIDVLVLAGYLWPNWRACTTDLDRGLSAGRMAILAEKSGIDAVALRSASLLPIAMAIGVNPPPTHPVWPWVLALGSRNRKRHGGLQYCAACLASDAVPYFRLQWRLAWHTCCSIHRVRLYDRCWRCHAPLEPTRLSAFATITSCASCEVDLRKGAWRPASESALAFQEYADAVARSGSGGYGQANLRADEWFCLSRYFLMLLRCAVRRQTSALSKCLINLNRQVTELRSPQTGLIFEMLSTLERSQFLGCVSALIQAGPDALRNAISEHAVNPTSLREGWQSLPRHIQNLVDGTPNTRCLRKKTDRKSSHRPLTPQGVLRKWARLQRKMRMKI